MPEPEKIPLAIENLFLKAKEAFENNRLDYCLTLLDTVLDTTRHYASARLLRRIVQLKALDLRSSSKITFLMNQLFSLIFSIVPLFLMARKDWINALDGWERVLKKNPSHILAMVQLTKCAMRLDWIQTAADTLEIIKKVDPNNVKAVRALAKLHMKEGNLDKSRRYFEQIAKFTPSDAEADRGLKDIDAISTIKQGMWEDSSDYRSKIKNEDQADHYEKEMRLVKTSEDIKALIKDLNKKLVDAPENTSYLKMLGDLHTQIDEYDQAIEYFENALKLNPSDSTISEEISLTKEKRIENEIITLKKRIEDTPKDSKLIEKLEKLKLYKQETKLEDCLDRVQRYPNNYVYRHELGIIYFSLGRTNDAIHQLQQSVKDPKLRLNSLFYLGRSFQNSELLDLAEKQFLKVLEDLYEMDEFKKEVTYYLGLSYESMNKIDEALIEYKKIFEVDIDYKDVSQKIHQARK